MELYHVYHIVNARMIPFIDWIEKWYEKFGLRNGLGVYVFVYSHHTKWSTGKNTCRN